VITKREITPMAKLIFKDHPHEWHNGSDFPKVPLTRLSLDTAKEKALAYVFFGYVQIDCDGSPTAYGPPEKNPDDSLDNAWKTPNGKDHWFGVVGLSENDPLVKNGTAKIDKKPHLLHRGEYPVIQRAENGDPNPGYYVSQTPHPRGDKYLQNSYLDPSKFSYGAYSTPLENLGFSAGDYGLAIRHNRNLQSGFYFADKAGTSRKLGECSYKVGITLGGSGKCKHFNNNFPVSFILFPGSHPEEVVSLSDEDIKKAIIPLVRNLSLAENADELALLMGFNEVQPQHKPRGTSKLETHRKHPSNLRPTHYDDILRGLTSFGWTPFLRIVFDTISLPHF
jgi:hypothetical protein